MADEGWLLASARIINPRMKKLLIVGAGGFGREVACWAAAASDAGAGYRPAGFLDDDPGALKGAPSGLPLLGSISGFVPTDETVLIIAVGRPDVRRRLHEGLALLGARFVNVIHPTALIAWDAEIGTGVVLAPYSVVSSRARLADGVALNFHAVVQHDAEVGAWSQINSHADVGGSAVLGAEVLVATHGLVPARARVPAHSVIPPGGLFGLAASKEPDVSNAAGGATASNQS